MNPLVVLNLGKGDCLSGLPIITAQLWHNINTVPLKFVGSLPPAPHLPLLYHRWRLLYQALYGRLSWRRGADNPIEFEPEGVTNVSKAEFHHLCEQLHTDLNQWLNAAGFRNIDQQLRTKLAPTEAIRLIIETDDPLLQKLPWLLWRFFEHYARAEVALSAQEYEPVHSVSPKSTRPMQILVVLGHSDGIDIQSDRAMLEQLPDAETTVLTEPSRTELDRWLWRQAGWDILFFAGHSVTHSTDVTGRLFLNPTEQLSIAQLKNALKAAISHGLKLAIFNSCDGSGLARALADLNLPQLIVMREPIPDPVAQAFLHNFLQVFSSGEAFYPAVRQAREQLQGLEGKFPCASWLPLIYQNPTEVPLTWPTAGQRQTLLSDLTSPRQRLTALPVLLRRLLSTSVAITLLVMMGRSLGWLQPLELLAYDHLLRARPAAAEPPIDDRLLVVEITPADTDQFSYPLKDEVVAATLAQLQRYQPLAIGLDLHRYQENKPGRQKLLDQFQQAPNLITICSFSQADRSIFGHPPEFSPKQALQQVGFSDLELDDALGWGPPVVRRQLLSYDPTQGSTASNCSTPYSFSLHLALHFLQAQEIQPLAVNSTGQWQLGHIVFERLAARMGGYQNLDGQSSQILLNYRFNRRPAQRVSLNQVLADVVHPDLIHNRIVLIGFSDPIGNDERQTPFGPLPGVWIHAHSLSHLLSAVLDNRPLLWTLPQAGGLQWGDALWIWTWALVGGLIGRLSPRFLLSITAATAALCLYQICLFLLIHAGWLPLIPALLALFGTASFLAAIGPLSSK